MKRFLFCSIILLAVGILAFKNPEPVLPNGMWRGLLERTDGEKIAFNFETQTQNDQTVMYVINGRERLLVDNIRYEGDSVFIQMPFFESGFRLKKEKDGSLSGIWTKRLADRDLQMPFKASYNVDYRYRVTGNTEKNISGRWAVNFIRNEKISKAVGEFKQEGSLLTGTFLTSSGDYRYLQGVVNGDSLFLSGFDGGFAHMFKARIISNDSISGGKLLSGPASSTSWSAGRDANAGLPDEYNQTKMKTGETRLDFSFRDLEGKMVSINDPKFRNKVVIVQILGSWCPNCMDETRFLTEFYDRYKARGVEVIGLAYERTTDEKRSLAALMKYQQRFNVQYPILLTGVAVSDSLRTEKTLPQIEEIKVFPTSIILNKKGDVTRIHTGFSGPGTGIHHENYKKDFERYINGLLD